MNKSELLSAIAQESGLTKADADKFLSAFINTTVNALKKDDKISLVGFLTIKKKRRDARTARNPRTGAEIKVPAKNVAQFIPGKSVNDAIN